MSDQEQITRERGQIVSSFALAEYLMSAFIAASYFKPEENEQLKKLIEEVFDDEYMSFGLKRNIFFKVLKNRFADTYKTFPKNELEKMRRLRNVAAHGLITAKGRVGSNEVFDVGIEHAGKKYTREMYKEYETLRGIVEPKLMKLPGLNVDGFLE